MKIAAHSQHSSFAAMWMDRLSINIERIVIDTKYIDYRLMEEYRIVNDWSISNILWLMTFLCLRSCRCWQSSLSWWSKEMQVTVTRCLLSRTERTQLTLFKPEKTAQIIFNLLDSWQWRWKAGCRCCCCFSYILILHSWSLPYQHQSSALPIDSEEARFQRFKRHYIH